MDIKTVEEKGAKRPKLPKWEIFWIVVESIIAVGGLFLLVLGIIGDNLQILASDNWILTADLACRKATRLSFRFWGAIALVGSALLAALTLNHFAKKTDRDEERENLRAQRLQIRNASAEAEKKLEEEKTVEVDSSPATKGE